MGRNRKFNDKEKWCPACEEWLSLDLFGNNRATLSGKANQCLACTANGNCTYRGRNKDKISRYMRKWHYGISEEKYQELLQKQDHRCALCKKRKRLCVDHDHETGEVRGLLCISCNALLGHFEKNTALLLAVLQYLGIKLEGGF